MPAITFDRFDGGLDVRQLASSADANRLRMLKNAYVTTGRTIRKRPGLKRLGSLNSGSFGLFGGVDALWTFSAFGGDHAQFPQIKNSRIREPYGKNMVRLIHAEVFNGFVYAVVECEDGSIEHHYLDGKYDTLIQDANCPHSRSLIKKAGKLFAIKNDVVRFSATGNALDWSTPDDAGFLPVALQQSVNNKPVALGEYQGNLVVFFEDSAQIWQVDPDPKNHKLISTVPIGTPFAYSHAGMGSDIFFLSQNGFRSVAVQAFSTNLMDNDIGSPIDALVQQDLKRPLEPKMVYWRGTGQLLCFMGDYAYVYSYSRSSKISAWSVWTFPFTVDAVAEQEAKLYLRSGADLYVFDPDSHSDNGQPIEVVAELPYLDMRKPGVLKQFSGVDVAAAGSLDMQFAFDPARPDLLTPPIHLSGDTRPLPRLPVEVMATNLSIRISNRDDKAFELASVTLYYELAGGFAV
nr:MAG TPA: stabilization protein [Caudoviricetes sp.]